MKSFQKPKENEVNGDAMGIQLKNHILKQNTNVDTVIHKYTYEYMIFTLSY